jgi:carboxypeptidase family protein
MTPVLRSASRFRTFVAILASVCLIALPSYAQMNSATLVGTVVDQGGALIVGANVVVRNTATNLSRSDTTTADGLFRIPDLPAGNYEVRVERAGFKTTVHSAVVLHVGETSRVDVTMQVGVIEQQVQVSSGSVLVNTEEARVTHIVEEKQLEELPLVRRNIYQLPVLEPGTQPTRVQIPTYYNNSVYELGFTTYGKRIRSTNFLLDSAPNTDNGLGGVPAIAPILDAVQEFQVSTNTFGREYGRNFGAVINVGTKSGTNGLHGSIWEFHRNAAMNASNFFDPGTPSALIHNQFGFTLGGPLRKDHTFWFLAYEGFREKRGTTRKIETETPEMRDWVHTNRPGSVADFLFQNFPGPAVDPATKTDIGTPAAPGAGPFAFDPTPDGVPDLALGVGQAINSTSTDQFNVRLDHVFRESDKVFFRYSGHYPRTTGVGELTTLGRLGRILRGFRRPLDGSLGNLAVGYTHMMSQNLLNDFRFGFLRNSASTGAFPDNVPNMVSDDFFVGFGSDFFLPLEFTNHEFNFRDTVVYSHGKHGIKLGLEYNHDVENGFFDAVARGFYEFANILDFANDAPYLQLQHLDPITGQSIITSPNHVRNFRRRDWAWFAQDDWKVRRNLTLNLGLRWEYFGVVQETSGKQAGITLGSGSDFQTQFVNSTLGPLKQMYNPYHKNFAPAVGMAWDPFSNGKFSVRAGWAMNYDRIHNDLLTEPARFTPPFGAFAVAVPILGVGGPIPYTVSDVIHLPPTPNPLCGGLNSSGALANCLVFPYLIDKNLKTPYVEEWNLTLQYEFAPDWVLDVGYAGNSAHRLAFTNDPNRVTGGVGGVPFVRPNPNLAWVSYLSTSQGSNYNGLTLQVKKRFTHGYLLQGSYTFGKVLDIQDDAFAGDFINAGTGYFGTNDVNNIRGDYGRSSFDIRHRITGNVVWDIGDFKNRGSAFHALLGGWQVNVIGSYESGRPFTVFNSITDYNADGGGGTQGGSYDRPDIPSFGNSIGCVGPDKFVAGIFEPTDFPVPAPGVSGNLGRNTFCGPNYKAVDFSLVKNITAHFLGEGGHIQFRVEAFNVFNRVNLYLPDSDLGAGNLTLGNPLFSTFGKSTQAFSPRELQLGLKISW